MSNIDFKKMAAFSIINCLEHLEVLAKNYPDIRTSIDYKSAVFKLQLLKDEDNSYFLGNYYEQYKKENA